MDSALARELSTESSRDVAALLATDDDQRSPTSHGLAKFGQAVVSADVDDQVVLLGSIEVIVSGVVKYVVGADRADQIDLRCAAVHR